MRDEINYPRDTAPPSWPGCLQEEGMWLARVNSHSVTATVYEYHSPSCNVYLLCIVMSKAALTIHAQ